MVQDQTAALLFLRQVAMRPPLASTRQKAHLWHIQQRSIAQHAWRAALHHRLIILRIIDDVAPDIRQRLLLA